jgi:acid stress-induced BolA-like protein IbaG/YrbA
MNIEIEVNEESKLLEVQKLLIKESLNELSEGRIYRQQQIVDEFNQRMKRNKICVLKKLSLFLVF